MFYIFLKKSHIFFRGRKISGPGKCNVCLPLDLDLEKWQNLKIAAISDAAWSLYRDLLSQMISTKM